MNKYLEFREKPIGEEYAVLGKGGFVGEIVRGEVFPKHLVLYPEWFTEWTSECLRQVADKLDALEAENE